MTTLYKLKDYKETFQFEKEHPKELRWDDKYKMYMLTQAENFQGIWIKDKDKIVAEALFSWESDNVVHIDSFTVLPSHRGQGLGYQLITDSIKWAEGIGFKYMTGEARKGTSWHIFENLGASVILKYVNWTNTGEDYMGFKLEI